MYRILEYPCGEGGICLDCMAIEQSASWLAMFPPGLLGLPNEIRKPLKCIIPKLTAM